MSDHNIVVIEILRDIRATQLEQAESIGKIGAYVEALSGPTGRVTKLENAQTRQWWITAAIAPLLGIAHAVSRKMGVDF